MVRLLGPQDRLLTTIEHQYPDVTVLVRGNHVTLEGPVDQVAAAERLVQELIQLVRNGADLGPVDVTSSARILERGEGSPAEVLSQAILTTRGKSIRPKTLGQKAYVDAIDQNTITFGIGPAGTGKTYLAMAKAVQALQRKEMDRIILTPPAVEARDRLRFPPRARRGGRRAARIPARHADRQDRPVPAPAVRRAERDDGSRARAEAARG